ncbi:lipase family protein [Actinomadura rayongensis]|uniref:Lipase n=1 Tax=Actinomadura rayongensis TaxID=1429076 RepID=A0A6I4W9G2_9ACTN|nr:lipase family protein [Actinomadura rayongensis]MXQ66817.1 lipase [Actinomadura rayongensis]
MRIFANVRVRRAGARRTALAVALLMVAALFVAPGAPASAAPGRAPFDAAPPGDDFYTPPSPLPAGAPGDVIRARPSKAGPPTARSLANAWEVMFLSTTADGKPNAVTGTVLVPKGVDPAKAPIVAFAPGTSGPAFRCAPSKMIDSGSFYEQAMLNELLKRKWAVAVPDYEGYHKDPTTSYMTGKALGHAVLDAVRAAQRLPEAGLSKDAKVLFHGYSQGGGAVMWAAQQQPEYAPELKLIGVSGGGVPGDIVAVALNLDGSPMFGFMLYALIGLKNAYPELPFDELLTDKGRTLVQNMPQNDCTLELITNYQKLTVDDIFTSSPLGDPSWSGRAVENRLGSTAIKVPVFQYHSKADEIVAFSQASRLHDKYCALGVQETWKTYDDLSHITLVYRGNESALAFLQDRLDGKPATSNC